MNNKVHKINNTIQHYQLLFSGTEFSTASQGSLHPNLFSAKPFF